MWRAGGLESFLGVGGTTQKSPLAARASPALSASRSRLVNPPQPDDPSEHGEKQAWSLPGMSLAFGLMAAINGFTGSCATLSHGLSLPHQASPASARRPMKILNLSRGGGASATRDAVA